jgi:predicted 3-demethylubiquinone-9 3-methyltransferase (glyoxalase superfamily)
MSTAAAQMITTLLMFEGKAEEAMTFYTSLFEDAEVVSIRGRASRAVERAIDDGGSPAELTHGDAGVVDRQVVTCLSWSL